MGNGRVKCQPRDRRARRKSLQQPRRRGGGKQHENAPIVGPPDEPAERLRQPGAHHLIVIRRSARCCPSCPMQHRGAWPWHAFHHRSEEHTSELQSLMRISYALPCLQNTNPPPPPPPHPPP